MRVVEEEACERVWNAGRVWTGLMEKGVVPGGKEKWRLAPGQ